MMLSYKHSGFSLLELMIILVIGSIILTMASASFSSMMANNRASTETNYLISSLHLARSESIKRAVNVSICSRALPRTSPETCGNTTDWADGWLLFTDDTGTAGDFDASDTLIQAKEGVGSNGIVTASANNIQYLPSGMAQSTANLTVRLVPCKGSQERAVSVARSGRVSTTINACP